MEKIDLTNYGIKELEELKVKITEEINRQTSSAEIVAYWLSLVSGNTRAGAKSWVKKVSGIQPSKGNGYGILGDFVGKEGAYPKGTYLLIGGSGGSWKNSTRYYVLVMVSPGSEFDSSSGYQGFKGAGVEEVINSDDEIDAQMAVDKYPDLSPCVGKDLFPIYYKLKEAGF